MNPKQGIFYLKLSNNFEISNIDQQRKLLENLQNLAFKEFINT